MTLDDKQFIGNLFKDKKLKKTKLIFRATKHGCNAETFHEKVDGRGPTIHIIKTEYGRVFGAYAQETWMSGGEVPETKYKRDENAFMFHVTDKKLHELIPEYAHKALRVES